jgi:hypothetical protein
VTQCLQTTSPDHYVTYADSCGPATFECKARTRKGDLPPCPLTRSALPCAWEQGTAPAPQPPSAPHLPLHAACVGTPAAPAPAVQDPAAQGLPRLVPSCTGDRVVPSSYAAIRAVTAGSVTLSNETVFKPTEPTAALVKGDKQAG